MQNIHYIHAKPDDPIADHWYYGAGWYFSDETGWLNGPYDTSELAAAALTDYVKWLNS